MVVESETFITCRQQICILFRKPKWYLIGIFYQVKYSFSKLRMKYCQFIQSSLPIFSSFSYLKDTFFFHTPYYFCLHQNSKSFFFFQKNFGLLKKDSEFTRTVCNKKRDNICTSAKEVCRIYKVHLSLRESFKYHSTTKLTLATTLLLQNTCTFW